MSALRHEEVDSEYDQPPAPDPTRPHSIDLTLELERQLEEADSLPSSPTRARHSQEHSRTLDLDPAVVASLLTQLRAEVRDLKEERDELKARLWEAETKASGLEDALGQVSAKCARVEEELAQTVEKQKEDEDAVTMLRSKLDDSRRALMRLQGENRRASMNIDLSRAGPSTLNGPPSSRRASFQPLTGTTAGRINAHRRISSVSDSGSLLYGEHGQLLGSPRGQLEPLHLLSNSAPPTAPIPAPNANRRISGFFGRAAQTPELSPTADAAEVEELRKELQAVKDQLDETRNELSEAKEAQEASETCANALRTFIADNSIGMAPPGGRAEPQPQPQPQRPHPAPRAVSDESRHSASASGSRWSFRLWNTPTNAPAAAGSASASSSPALPSAPAPASISALHQAQSAQPPLARKLGGFFSGRGSVSSTASGPTPLSHQQEPLCNGSDSSSDDSATEPISPASELPGTSVHVQSLDRTPPQGVLTDSPEQQKTELLQVVDLDHGRLVTVT